MSIKSVMPSSHLILCHPLLLLPPIPPSIRVFSSESSLHIRWPKYRSFSFSITPSNEYSDLGVETVAFQDFMNKVHWYTPLEIVCHIHLASQEVLPAASVPGEHCLESPFQLRDGTSSEKLGSQSNLSVYVPITASILFCLVFPTTQDRIFFQ